MATPKQSPIIPLFFEDNPVRVIDRDGEVWFVGKDVCRALEITNHNDALGRLDDDERMDGVGITDRIGREQKPILISMPGCYRLIFTSRLPSAERFKRWVAHDVLPSIYKTGAYIAPEVKKSPRGADVSKAQLQDLVETQKHLIHIQTQLFDFLHKERQGYIATEIIQTLVEHTDLDDATIAEVAKAEVPYVAYVRRTAAERARPPV